MKDQLTLFAVDTPASRSVLPENKKEAKTTDTYGRQCSRKSNSTNQLGLLGKTLKDTLTAALIAFAPTWKVLVTPQGRSVFRLSLSEPTTTEKEYGLSPTPQAMDAMKARSPGAIERQMTTARKGREKIATMKDVAVYGLYWNGQAIRLGDGELNPQRLEWMMGYPIGWTEIEPSVIPCSHKFPKL